VNLLYACTSISSRKNINLFPYVQVENASSASQVFDQSVGKTLRDCLGALCHGDFIFIKFQASGEEEMEMCRWVSFASMQMQGLLRMKFSDVS
jgi:hypothetical protein